MTGTRDAIGALLLALAVGLSSAVTTIGQDSPPGSRAPFDHQYAPYADLLETHVVGQRVDYRRLTDARAELERVVAEFGEVSDRELAVWSEDEQLAFWINAYNVLTLDAITSHYPIRNRWFTIFGFVPPNSIKQIPGVWTRLRWPVGGAPRTLDEIEHEIIRVRFDEPRIHFAVNCAAISCPPLRSVPYVASQLDTQLTTAAREFLAGRHGTKVDGSTLHVSRIFSWYGEDFVAAYGAGVGGNRSPTDRAILEVVAALGPTPAARLARRDTVELVFLDYDWGLNDVSSP